jgi:hypothetical protein
LKPSICGWLDRWLECKSKSWLELSEFVGLGIEQKTIFVSVTLHCPDNNNYNEDIIIALRISSSGSEEYKKLYFNVRPIQ